MKAISSIVNDSLKNSKSSSKGIKISIMIAVTIIALIFIEHQSWDVNNRDILKSNVLDYVAIVDGVNEQQYEAIQKDNSVKKVMVLYEEQFKEKYDMRYLSYEKGVDINYAKKVVKGRSPQNSNEVAVTEQLVKEDRSYGIGGKIKIGEKEKVITGLYPQNFGGSKYDVYGILDKDSIKSNVPAIHAYVWLKNPKETYKVIPNLVKNISYNSNVEINIEYNESYLGLERVYNGKIPSDVIKAMIIDGAVVVLLIILFANIISNSFIVWSTRDLKEIGLLKSVGMTPKQTRNYSILKTLRLSTIPIFLGIILAHGIGELIYLGHKFYAMKLGAQSKEGPFYIRFNLKTIILIIVVSYIIIFISAMRPARISNRISIIDAIKNNFKVKHVKYRQGEWKGNILKAIAKDNYRAYKNNYLAMTISLIVSCFIFSILLISFSCESLVNKYDSFHSPFNINVRGKVEGEVNPELISKLEKNKEVNNIIIYSEELSYIDGINKDKIIKSGVKLDNFGKSVNIYGIQDEYFNEFLSSKGIDSKKYYGNEYNAVVVDKIPSNPGKPYTRWKNIAYINPDLKKLSLNEDKTLKNKNSRVDFNILDRVDEVPKNFIRLKESGMILMLPLSQYNKYYQNKEFYKAGNAYKYVTMALQTTKEKEASAKENLNEIVKNYMGERTYSVSTSEDNNISNKIMNSGELMIVIALMIFMLVIGFINAYCSMNMTLKSRAKDISIMRSVGLESKRLLKIFKLESWIIFRKFFIITIGGALIFAEGYAYLGRHKFSAMELLSSMNWILFIGYSIVLFLGIYLSTQGALNKMMRKSIVENIRTE